MKKINVFIVEDVPDFVAAIRKFITLYNGQQSDLAINVVGHSDKPQIAIDAIKSNIGTENEVELVLLDYHLPGRRNGFQISCLFPNLSYLIMSESEIAIERYKNEKHLYRYMGLVPNAIDIHSILESIIIYANG